MNISKLINSKNGWIQAYAMEIFRDEYQGLALSAVSSWSKILPLFIFPI